MLITIKNLIRPAVLYFILPGLTYYLMKRYFPTPDERQLRDLEDFINKYPDLSDERRLRELEDFLKKYSDVPDIDILIENALKNKLKIYPYKPYIEDKPTRPIPLTRFDPEEFDPPFSNGSPTILPPPGGFLHPKDFFNSLYKLCLDHRAELAAVAVLCIGVSYQQFCEALAEITLKLGPSVFALGRRGKTLKRLIGSSKNGKEVLAALQRGIMSKELTFEEKAELFREACVGIVRISMDPESRKSILTGLFVIIFGVWIQSHGLLGGSILTFREIFSKKAFLKTIIKSIVNDHKEVNAPLPQTLTELAVEAGLLYNIPPGDIVTLE